MTCRELFELLMDYLEGALPPPQVELVEAHIADCDDCRSYIGAYREARDLVARTIRAEQPPDPPEELVQAILESRRKKPR